MIHGYMILAAYTFLQEIIIEKIISVHFTYFFAQLEYLFLPTSGPWLVNSGLEWQYWEKLM